MHCLFNASGPSCPCSTASSIISEEFLEIIECSYTIPEERSLREILASPQEGKSPFELNADES